MKKIYVVCEVNQWNSYDSIVIKFMGTNKKVAIDKFFELKVWYEKEDYNLTLAEYDPNIHATDEDDIRKELTIIKTT